MINGGHSSPCGTLLCSNCFRRHCGKGCTSQKLVLKQRDRRVLLGAQERRRPCELRKGLRRALEMRQAEVTGWAWVTSSPSDHRPRAAGAGAFALAVSPRR